MTDQIELACSADVQLPVGRLSRGTGGAVFIQTASGASEMVDSELADTDDLKIAAFARWMVALGDASHTLMTWDVTDPSLRAVGELDRLELTGYDPGGLRRVRMVRVDDESVLVETEVGLALVRFGGWIAWQFIHDDMTSRVRGVHNGVVEVRSESAVSRYATSDGAYLGGEPIDVGEV